MSTSTWGEWPYDSKAPAEVVHDYAVIRGDLSEQYARDQLAEWIERYAAHSAAAALTEAADEVHRESRWSLEMTMRGTPPDAVDRLLLVERVLRDRIPT